MENKKSNLEQNPPFCKTDVRRSFFKEFDYTLDKVERKWLRRSVTILLSPMIIIGGALIGAFELGKQWFNECW